MPVEAVCDKAFIEYDMRSVLAFYDLLTCFILFSVDRIFFFVYSITFVKYLDEHLILVNLTILSTKVVEFDKSYVSKSALIRTFESLERQESHYFSREV